MPCQFVFTDLSKDHNAIVRRQRTQEVDSSWTVCSWRRRNYAPSKRG